MGMVVRLIASTYVFRSGSLVSMQTICSNVLLGLMAQTRSDVVLSVHVVSGQMDWSEMAVLVGT